LRDAVFGGGLTGDVFFFAAPPPFFFFFFFFIFSRIIIISSIGFRGLPDRLGFCPGFACFTTVFVFFSFFPC